MFIAHIPAGYLTAATAQRLGLWTRGLMVTCFMGAHVPDYDLAYCYFVDEGKVHHHLYWTHYPVAWLGLLLLSLLAWWLSRGKTWAILCTFFTGSALLHIALDGVAGDIPLFAPWDMQLYSCVTVHPHHDIWWMNFLLHWTFLAELGIVLAAAFIFIRRRIRGIRRLHRRFHHPSPTLPS